MLLEGTADDGAVVVFLKGTDEPVELRDIVELANGINMVVFAAPVMLAYGPDVLVGVAVVFLFQANVEVFAGDVTLPCGSASIVVFPNGAVVVVALA